MILQRYLARRFLRQFLLVAGAFLAILFLIDLVEQIRRFGGEGVGLRRVAGLAALNIAGSICVFTNHHQTIEELDAAE